MKESRSTELEEFVKQILKASPRILQNYLILIQGCMAGAVAVSYGPTQNINVMLEFLLIFLTDIPKRYIHRDKLNDMFAHVGVLTRKISILVSKLPESSQIRFPIDDGLLFMNLLLRHLNDLLISNAYSGALIKKEIGMVTESLEFLRSSFGKVRQTLYDTSGVVKYCWIRALDVTYEAEHVINSILVRDNAPSHLIFSLSSVTDKINLIMVEVTKSSDEPIKSTSSFFVKVTVGHEE
ncbi:hypothetical protein H5410_022547 [Solanum commersonii]|uniref:Uncharacterized protein n=1 Tax=Solanum commersonii TaxID=4109 RepID=A0A9J5ZF38_SOLCO|nr:hypothetical protein H5410_022547 [Solanum commersonii]